MLVSRVFGFGLLLLGFLFFESGAAERRQPVQRAGEAKLGGELARQAKNPVFVYLPLYGVFCNKLEINKLLHVLLEAGF